MENVYTANFNPETGRVAAPAQKIIRQFEGYNEAPAYSSDGKYIAYISCRSPMVKPFGADVRGGNVLCIKSLETDKVQEINPSLHHIGYPSWSPDGNSIAIVHWSANDRIELCCIDVQTEHVSVLSRPASDGNYILFGIQEAHQDEETSSTDQLNSIIVELYRIPVSGGEPEKLGLKMKMDS